MIDKMSRAPFVLIGNYLNSFLVVGLSMGLGGIHVPFGLAASTPDQVPMLIADFNKNYTKDIGAPLELSSVTEVGKSDPKNGKINTLTQLSCLKEQLQNIRSAFSQWRSHEQVAKLFDKSYISPIKLFVTDNTNGTGKDESAKAKIGIQTLVSDPPIYRPMIYVGLLSNGKCSTVPSGSVGNTFKKILGEPKAKAPSQQPTVEGPQQGAAPAR